MNYYGWQRDLPDIRDLNLSSPKVSNLLKDIPIKASNKVDLRQWFSPIENQSSLGSCTAHAGVGLLEYFEKKAYGKFTNASRLFLYKTTRNLMKVTGDTGAFLRGTMKAMVIFGIPPEDYYPYDIKNFDNEPSAFLYSFAEIYKSIVYYKLSPSGISKTQLLADIKDKLSQGLPSMFGFSVYSSMTNNALIPFPTDKDTLRGGHAVVACGYDDNLKIGDYTGALLIRNSWGTGFGEQGYGWLPYQYVLSGLATDFWSLMKAEYLDTDFFN